jgi:hypothetical protein
VWKAAAGPLEVMVLERKDSDSTVTPTTDRVLVPSTDHRTTHLEIRLENTWNE